MIEDVKEYLVGIVIGIRFGPNFSIRDDFGNMADKILYKRGSLFDEKMFPLVGVNPAELRLHNDKSGDSLVINSSDVVLTCNVGNPDLTLDPSLTPRVKSDMLPEVHRTFEQDILGGVLREYKFDRIRRVGYINRYIFNAEGLPQRFTSRTIGDTIGGINDIDLRFSKRYPVPEALVKKDVDDYHNVIFTIEKKADKDEIFVSLDYQAFYKPALESMRDVAFPGFLNLMESYNSKTFSEWLNEHFGE